jgi:hypothetical protein
MAPNQARYFLHRLEAGAQGARTPAFQKLPGRCRSSQFATALGAGTVSKILRANAVQPHKIRYYLEQRDPEFESKMKQVLHVDKQIEVWHKLGALLKITPQIAVFRAVMRLRRWGLWV